MIDFPFDGIKLELPTDEEVKNRILNRYKNNKNEFRYWFPVVSDLKLNCRVPETQYFEYPYENLRAVGQEQPSLCDFSKEVKTISDFADKVGYPVFIKTGLFSGKHDWKNTCEVRRYEDIEEHILNLLYANICVGCDGSLTLVVREMVETSSTFTAFDGMPVTEEWRLFSKDGETYAYQPYWPEEAIVTPSIDNWKEELAKLKNISEEDLARLVEDANKVSKTLGGGWSVDFLKDTNGDFWVIDMAEDTMSYISEKEVVRFSLPDN